MLGNAHSVAQIVCQPLSWGSSTLVIDVRQRLPVGMHARRTCVAS